MAWIIKGGQTLKSDSLLLLTACIWGFAFVAQRLGMQYVGPFGFNGVRFGLGCLVLLPLLITTYQKNGENTADGRKLFSLPGMAGGLLAGFVLFLGASFQQVAMVYTTAGNAGFITGLYVVLVPIIGIILGHRTHAGTWIGAVLAAVGLYLLSITAELTISSGDLLVLIGAFFWACHVHLIGWLSPKGDPLKISFLQYAACSLLSMAASALFEKNTMNSYVSAILPILYGGVLSVGVAYTLQVIAQKKAKPAHAAIILSLEAVFAALGGRIILDEVLTFRALIGCGLMLGGMLVSQLWKMPWRDTQEIGAG
ncbi:MAG TPA: DMT family transporter [Desulfomonilia bacterium]|nr:DMT family transporter [Desulfomonilia bacterium]